MIKATSAYRWLHDLLAPLGTVLVAHTPRPRAMVQRRAKTDRLDGQLLADLLPIAPGEDFPDWRDEPSIVTRDEAGGYGEAVGGRLKAPGLARAFIRTALIGVTKSGDARPKAVASSPKGKADR